MFVLESSVRSIIMEYVQGDKIDELDKLQEKYGDPRKVGNKLIDIFARMIYLNGTIHCDAHPGNIFVRPHPDNEKEPQIVLLDHGFYAHLTNEFRL